MIAPVPPPPELVREHPKTWTVFSRLGLRACGGNQGPAEAPGADAIYRPFFLTAIGVMVTMGALWGTFILWKIGFSGSYTGVTVHEVNAHGHAQIMGWVGFFIMGFALQAFPRIWQVALPAPQWALVTWLVMLVSLAARTTAIYFNETSWAREIHGLGSILEIAAVSCFIGIILTALFRSGHAFQPYAGFVLAALGFMLLQSVFGSWHVDRLISATNRDALLAQIATFQAPLRDMQVHGMAMLMIFGVGLRKFPAMFGLPEIRDRRAWFSLGLFVVAIVGEIGLFLAYRLTENHAWAAALLLPWLLLPIAAANIVFRWKLWRPLPPPGCDDRSGKFVRAAFTWLFVSFTMLLLMPVYQVISGIAFSHAYYGGVRHAITVGFISMMIVGMGAKVVPTLRGIAPDHLPRLWLPFVLINIGCLLRVSLQVATDWHPAAFQLVGISGMLEWTGFAIWGAHLVVLMIGARSSKPKLAMLD